MTKTIIGIILLSLSFLTLHAEINKNINKDDIRNDPDLFFDANARIKRDKPFILSMAEYLSYNAINKNLQRDKEVALAFLKEQKYSMSLDEIDEVLLKDKNFILSIIKELGYGLKYASNTQLANKELVLLGLRNESDYFKRIAPALKTDDAFIKEALQTNGLVLEHLPKKYKASKKWVLVALKEDPNALAYASNMLRSNEEVVQEAVKKDGNAFEFSHPYLKENKTFVLSLLKKKFYIFDYIDETLQKDQLLIEIALEYDHTVWDYLHENFKNDRNYLIKLIKKNPNLLENINEEFQKDKDIVSTAVTQNAYLLTSAHSSLKEDKNFLSSLINQQKDVLEYIDEKVWEDKAFLLEKLNTHGYGLKYASKEQQDNRTLVMKSINYDGFTLAYASERLKKDKLLVLKAINEYSDPLKFADNSLKIDQAFMKEAIAINSFSITSIDNPLKYDKELIILALSQNAKVFKYLPQLQKDKAFILEMIEKNINVLPYIDKSLKKDKDIIKSTETFPRAYEELESLLNFLAILLLMFFFYFLIKQKKVRMLYLSTAILLFIMSKLLQTYFAHGALRSPYVMIDKFNKFGLERVPCWVSSEEELSHLECYNMHVPEIHNDPNSNVITFPLRVFRSTEIFSSKAPLLHLGGGGPGASMYLNTPYVLRAHLEQHNAFSLDQGRDLFIIDPRGAGLSQPLLNCDTYVDNFLTNMKKELSLNESYNLMSNDYGSCVQNFKQQNINFNGYNSLAVSNDIHLLKKATGIQQWILFGVSYSTTYAMFVAKQYPEMVKSLILDSACFPSLKLDHNYLLQQMDGYKALSTYKDKVQVQSLTNDTNEDEDKDVIKRMWALSKQLNQNPIQTTYLDLKIDGNYFISSLLNGVYGTKIFQDLPKIILEMEQNKTKSFLPYFKNYLNFLVDRDYADISAMAHYCYEDKPFIDFPKIKALNSTLPKGFIQESAILALEFNDFCKEMNINSNDKTLANPIKTDIPTLFIHGEFDSVTPLRDVVTQMKNFKNSKLITYKTSHAVLGTEDKVEADVADFLEDSSL
ncbi:MAG: Membrane protein, putative [uncultured Sulfurovum sp.]|uniref:Membrane protein, putative n=1 Tax=uncultured Sulfurovum sp. TaxID=269237 RepID=A0A6S6SUK1_9BACT|nr:MAG: Membrane protein, putative [uncultured Sulfurovum sp.]